MSIDRRIREGLRMTNTDLPRSDTVGALDAVTTNARTANRRRRLVAAAAVVATVVAIGAAVATTSVTDHDSVPRPVDRNDQDLNPPPAGPGLFTFPPVGAAPSTPKHGELVALMSSCCDPTVGDGITFLYADGRLIWSRPTDTGWVEQHLTPEGVELVRTEIISTGLFDPDRPPADADPDETWGEIRVRTEGQLVDVPGSHGEPWSGELLRLQQRLWNLSWLPDDAWDDRELKTYAPSRYAIVLSDDAGSKDSILPLLPASVQELLPNATPCPQQLVDPGRSCFDVTTEEARTVAEALDDAEIRKFPEPRGLLYQFEDPDSTSRDIYIGFQPYLPHGDVALWGG